MHMINHNSPYVQHMHSNLYRSQVWTSSIHMLTILDVCTFHAYSKLYNTVYTVQYVQITCTTQYTLYSMYRSHVQHSTHCTVCTDHMYNTAHTVQYVQNPPPHSPVRSMSRNGTRRIRLRRGTGILGTHSTQRMLGFYYKYWFRLPYRHSDITIKCLSKWLPQWTTFHVMHMWRCIFNARPSFGRVERKLFVKYCR